MVNACADTVTVTISGLQSSQGYLLVGLFNSHAALESSKHQDGDKYAVAYKVVEVKELTTTSGTVIFENIPEGVYAVGVIRDLNSNGKLDTTGVFRKPVEPFGMSGNPRFGLQFPKWEAVSFQVKGNTTIPIQLKRL
jgi:uncharacterized protein (DUF2141 family)